jgi:hypothetical protein
MSIRLLANVLVSTGVWADTNPYQFSSKERDGLTGFSYYGFRYYNSSTRALAIQRSDGGK